MLAGFLICPLDRLRLGSLGGVSGVLSFPADAAPRTDDCGEDISAILCLLDAYDSDISDEEEGYASGLCAFVDLRILL